MVVLTKQTFLIQISYNYTVFSKIYDNLLSKLVKITPGIEKMIPIASFCHIN